MKGFRWQFSLGFIVWSIAGLGCDKLLAALPLQEGVYKISSRYVQIAQKETRICFKVFSAKRGFIASAIPDSSQQNYYRIDGKADIVLIQQDRETLLFGMSSHLAEYVTDYEFPKELDEDLQACLNSKEPFYKEIFSDRESRL